MKLGDDEFIVVVVQFIVSQQFIFYFVIIKGVQDIEVCFQVFGFIVKFCVDEGVMVKKGQVFFQIDFIQYVVVECQVKVVVEMVKLNVNMLFLNE